MKKNKKIKFLFNTVTLIITILIILFIIYGIQIGVFSDKMLLVNYISKFGIFAPALFIFIQIIQVIFPIIPGGASCLAGVLAFGGTLGFIYNEIGLVIGSICAYSLAKKYGLTFVKSLFKEETVEKYLVYIRNDVFKKIFLWGIILPGAPDDLFCYIAGLSNMTFKEFFIIIVLGKPLTLLLYSLFMGIL